MKHDCASTTRLARLCWIPCVALLAALPAHAQYKVVGADGKVTYTDRAAGDGRRQGHLARQPRRSRRGDRTSRCRSSCARRPRATR